MLRGVTFVSEYQFPGLPILTQSHYEYLINDIWLFVCLASNSPTTRVPTTSLLILPHLIWNYFIDFQFDSAWLLQSHQASVHWHSKTQDEIVHASWILIRAMSHSLWLPFNPASVLQWWMLSTEKNADLFFYYRQINGVSCLWSHQGV